jgi:O-antigen/teichoic acid export membrane protein
MTMRERKWAALYQGLDPWIRVGFALLFIALFGAEGMAILAALILAAGVMAAGQFSFLLGRWQPLGRGLFEPLTAEVTRDLSRSFRNYSKPFVFFGILSALSLYSDRWILQWLLGKYEVGVYAALFQIASAPIAFVAGVVAQYLTPIVFERANKDRRADGSSAGQRLLSKSTLFTSVLLGLGVIAAVKLGQPLVGLLTNSEFARHGDLLWLFVLGWSFFQMAQLLVTHGLIAFRPDVYYVPKALQSLIFVFAGTGLAQWQGLQGMCWALCISSFMYFLSVVAVNKFVLKRPSVSTDIQ